MESSSPKVSIIIPVYNVERFLRECLDSVLNQTLRNIEIICVNDGSTDSSPAILEEYARRDSRVKIISKANSGYGNTMNRGLDAATGEYIGIVESDDFASPDMFETLVGLAETHRAEVVKTNYYTHTSDSEDAIFPVLPDGLCERLINPVDSFEIFRVRPSIWAGLYRRDFLVSNGIRFLETPGASFQDSSFIYKVLLCARRVWLSRAGYLHYRTDNAGSSVKQQSKVFCVCDEYAEMERFLREKVTNHRELLSRLKELNRLKFNTYIWNYNRLDSAPAGDFLERMSLEFGNSNRAGEIAWNMFHAREQLNLKYIIERPEYFHKRKVPCENPVVSVVIPVYNAERFLRECLDTLLDQTIRDVEFICVDDGSTDGSVAILQEYAGRDARVIVRTQPNSGAAVARNNGISIARGRYLSILDADDRFDYRMLERLVARAEEVRADITICKCDGFDSTTGRINPISWSLDSELLPDKDPFCYRDMPESIFNFCQGWAWDKLYLTSFVRENKLEFQNLKATNDMLFVFLSLVKARRISVINDVLIHQRQNLATSISKSRHKNCDCFCKALIALRDGVMEMGIYDEVERSLKNWTVLFSMWHLNTLAPHKEAFMPLYEKLRGELLPEMGIGGQDEEYYAEKSRRQYRQCEEILSMTLTDYLYTRWQAAVAPMGTAAISSADAQVETGRRAKLARKIRSAKRIVREYGVGYTMKLAWGMGMDRLRRR